MIRSLASVALAAVFSLCSVPAFADGVVINTGGPDGKIATGSQQASPGKGEIETADDFLLTQPTAITGGSFTGLIPEGAVVQDVTIEIYRVFPLDSTDPPSGHVTTRMNSPSDVEFSDRTASSANLSFTTTVLSSSFTASNSVVLGIHPFPEEFTGGEGPVTGQEVQFDFTIDPDLLATGHYFFVPQVQLAGTDNFLWLSAPKPIVAPGTPFDPDLQTWIRNDEISPDWLRVGTDITHQGPFNASFSLNGTPKVPEPCTLLLTGTGLLGLLAKRKARTS